MISPSNPQISWGSSIDLEARELPDWTEGQPLSWTISSGQGSLLDPSGIKIKFTAPQGGPDVPHKTVIHLYAGVQGQLVGECTVTLAADLPWAKLLEELPQEPEPEPPPEEEEIEEPHDCCADPHQPDEPLKVVPSQIQADPLQKYSIRIPYIYEECDDGCYDWIIKSGGGTLLCDCGPRAIYQAPRTNENCEANAVVELICNGEPVAQCYISINTLWHKEAVYAEYDHEPTWETSGPRPPVKAGVGGTPPAEATYQWLHLKFYMRLYNCMSELIIERPYHNYTFSWGYSMWQAKWFLYTITTGAPFANYESQKDIDWSHLNIPADQDIRTDYQKLRGCCPLKLLIKQFYGL